MTTLRLLEIDLKVTQYGILRESLFRRFATWNEAVESPEANNIVILGIRLAMELSKIKDDLSIDMVEEFAAISERFQAMLHPSHPANMAALVDGAEEFLAKNWNPPKRLPPGMTFSEASEWMRGMASRFTTPDELFGPMTLKDLLGDD